MKPGSVYPYFEGDTIHFEDNGVDEPSPVVFTATQKQLDYIDGLLKWKLLKWKLIMLLAGLLAGALASYLANYRRVYDMGYTHATRDFQKQLSDQVQRFNNWMEGGVP